MVAKSSISGVFLSKFTCAHFFLVAVVVVVLLSSQLLHNKHNITHTASSCGWLVRETFPRANYQRTELNFINGLSIL